MKVFHLVGQVRCSVGVFDIVEKIPNPYGYSNPIGKGIVASLIPYINNAFMAKLWNTGPLVSKN